jgi:hypothetical protein
VRVRLADIKDHIHAVRTFLDPPLGSDAQPLDIRAAVVDAVESRIAVLDVGRTVFPYDRIVVRLITGPGREKAPLAMAFAELERKVRERLRERRCEVPPALQTSVSISEQPPSDWTPGQLFSLDYDNRADAQEPEAPPAWPLLTLTVLEGTATQPAYSFRQPTVLIGRTTEALDTKGRVRRNHVAFDDRNSTVSRAHARLKYDTVHARYRLVDERSTRGTHVVRDGAAIPVPRDSRGIRLESGDEVHLGDATVRVTIE